MNEIYSYDYTWLDWDDGKITICSGPVIINDEKKVLLHISSSTNKYQFIWGRLNDSESLQENVITRAAEVLWHPWISLVSETPLSIYGEIIRDWVKEKLVLFHYLARLDDENNIWTAEWKTLKEIEELSKNDMLSSNNILIAVKHFI